MVEREDIPAEDPADSTERRDWDLPPDAHEGGEKHSGPPPGFDDPGLAAPPDVAESPDDQDDVAQREPPDESEKRDWDVP